ncbi:MAG: pantoate--beta-alanine ligase [Bacteroidota bacterium]
MLLLKTKKGLVSHLGTLKNLGSLALVPTMGALHAGHLSLVKKAILENDLVIVSIFVNPTQFNNSNDLKKYPKTLSADVDLLKTISRNIMVFAPSITDIYPEAVSSRNYDFGGLDKVMEGNFREGHFNGVGTVVEALLRLIAPDRAYFGEKDFQQLQIIRQLVRMEEIPVDIIGCPIVREHNGLAMSSRNERLSPDTRKKAGLIYKTLKTAKKIFGTKSAKYVKEWVRMQFGKHPDFKLEYIEITDTTTLAPVQRKRRKTKYRAFVAVYADGVRLIDNIALN